MINTPTTTNASIFGVQSIALPENSSHWSVHSIVEIPFTFRINTMNDDIVAESYRLHQLAWSQAADYEKYMEEAFSILEKAYETGDHRHLIINNYAAVLLNLHRNHEAMDLLKKYQPECSVYCLNYAIAIAKTHYNLHEIRKWNIAAMKYPKLENAIEAYIDWQGF